jgi:D-glycero-D-manno-heptose 1,7-bisphosphate phosphatase
VIVLPGPAGAPGLPGLPEPGDQGYAVLLDRDGTLIEDVPSYVRSEDDVRLLPQVAPAAATFARLGVRLGIVSNQAAIGRGLLTREQVVRLHAVVVDRLATSGLRVSVSALCPHAPEDGCPCRKPRPGLLIEAARVLGVPPERCFVIGDAARDVEAARAAGMHPLLVLTGHGPAARQALAAAGDGDVEVCADVAGAAAAIAGLLDSGLLDSGPLDSGPLDSGCVNPGR